MLLLLLGGASSDQVVVLFPAMTSAGLQLASPLYRVRMVTGPKTMQSTTPERRLEAES